MHIAAEFSASGLLQGGSNAGLHFFQFLPRDDERNPVFSFQEGCFALGWLGSRPRFQRRTHFDDLVLRQFGYGCFPDIGSVALEVVRIRLTDRTFTVLSSHHPPPGKFDRR